MDKKSNINILPIILYDLEGKAFGTHNITTKSPTIYFYSYQNFDVKIIGGEGELYSVVQKTNSNNEKYLETKHGQEFSGFVNFGYTLFIPKNKTSVKIKVTNVDGFVDTYTFNLKLINQETEKSDLYNDLIINNYLPTLDELEKAMLPDSEKSELLKRMLLDFKHIMRIKGTKEGIEQFFYFIGFLPEQLAIFEEYKRNGTSLHNNNHIQNVTTKPDKLVDTKTGNYHVLYNNWDDGVNDGKQQLNQDNLPYRPFDTENFDSLFESLKYAIPLANKYFTLVEQEITFFGICFSSNIPMYPNMSSTLNQIFVNDVYDFRKDLHIDLSFFDLSYAGENYQTFIVENCLQKSNTAYRTEVKYIVNKKLSKYNGEIYFVEREVLNNEEFTEDFVNYRRAFGALLHLVIKSPNTYIKVSIINRINKISRLVYDKTWCDDVLDLQYITERPDIYDIIIEITDKYNNVERYFYEYNISDNVSNIDIDVFNSLLILDKNLELNEIDLDVDAPSIIKTQHLINNYILPLNNIPDDLTKYFKTYIPLESRYLSEASDSTIDRENPQYILPEINKNFKIQELTETIPLELTDQWLEICSVPFYDELFLQVYDSDICEYLILPIVEAFKIDETLDKLFIRTLEVIDQETNNKEKYYYVIPLETGIEVSKKTFDLYVMINNEYKSIYELEDTVIRKIPVNYDFPLFPIKGPEFIYCSENYYSYRIGENEYPIIKSMFPRMINSLSPEFDEMSILKFGDVILARINKNYIVNESNLIWTVFNEFTGEQLFLTTDYMLKYRIEDNIIYTIKCEFNINYVKHSIIKTGIFSSFKRVNYE